MALFTPFERLGAEQTTIEGTGLGLVLSKGLVEAMGGTIQVSSTPGGGSTFTVELAAIPAPAVEVEERSAEQLTQLEVLNEARVPKILYIEDNISNLKLVERTLERHSPVELIAAMQGSIGLELSHEHHPRHHHPRPAPA